ncbi:MAG: copper-binding protein [Burkholderiales bacterium]
MKRIAHLCAIVFSTVLTFTAISTAYAQTAPGNTMTDGEVRRIDKDAKKLTIRHGPIKNLDMPAMTMVFQVKDPAMLDKINTGDKIKFAVEKIGGAYIVTHVEPGT